MRIPKLISGKMNIPYIILKAGYAHGVTKPKRVKKQKEVSPFNSPVLCIKIRKAV